MNKMQNVSRASKTRGRCVKIVVFMVIYEFVMSCKKYYNGYTLVTNSLCAHTSNISVLFLSLINTKITFSWAHKQFATRVHTLFYFWIVVPVASLHLSIHGVFYPDGRPFLWTATCLRCNRVQWSHSLQSRLNQDWNFPVCHIAWHWYEHLSSDTSLVLPLARWTSMAPLVHYLHLL